MGSYNYQIQNALSRISILVYLLKSQTQSYQYIIQYHNIYSKYNYSKPNTLNEKQGQSNYP